MARRTSGWDTVHDATHRPGRNRASAAETAQSRHVPGVRCHTRRGRADAAINVDRPRGAAGAATLMPSWSITVDRPTPRAAAVDVDRSVTAASPPRRLRTFAP